jgi:hypothetical protein
VGEKYQCNICNLLIDANEIENHIKTQDHQNLQHEYLQQLNSSKKTGELTNTSSFYEWKKYQKKF